MANTIEEIKQTVDNKLNLFIQKMNGYLIYSIYKKLKLQAFGACFTLKVIQLAEYTTFFLQKLRKEFFTGAILLSAW